MPAPIHTRAHAKVNLALAVGPAVSGGAFAGFHPIASWMAPIELADDLAITPLPPGSPSRYTIAWAPPPFAAPRPTPIDWPLEKDLAVRAHRLLEAHAGRALPIDLRLDKRIPVGGGLGGGSADAAAVLRTLNELFDLRLTPAALLDLARQLGSDVAFFLDPEVPLGAPPRPAIVTGFGDQIERLPPLPSSPLPAAELVLLFPPFGCPTGPVYRAYDEDPVPLNEPRIRALAATSPPTSPPAIPWHDLFNDLEAPAARAVPPFADLLARLRAKAPPGTPIHVSGSGSTLFTPGASAAWAEGEDVVIHPTRLAVPEAPPAPGGPHGKTL